MNHRAARSLRGLGAGTTATIVAAVSHGLAGGTFPGLAGIALALVFSAIVSIALVGLRMPVLRLAASIVLSQLAFHVVFSTLGNAAEVTVTGGHHGAVSVVGTEIVSHASALMWFAHAIAAALTLLALVFGERAIIGLRETARMLLARVLRPAPVARPATLPRVARPQLSPVAGASRDLVAACGLRGPPLLPRSA
jgi:hypothetical protein